MIRRYPVRIEPISVRCSHAVNAIDHRQMLQHPDASQLGGAQLVEASIALLRRFDCRQVTRTHANALGKCLLGDALLAQLAYQLVQRHAIQVRSERIEIGHRFQSNCFDDDKTIRVLQACRSQRRTMVAIAPFTGFGLLSP